MAENLNYEMDNSYCYDDDAVNCDMYGRLYGWAASLNACPSGWHLPSEAEFETLINAVGDSSVAGTKLKSTVGWIENGNGTDNYGFSALPAGDYDSTRERFELLSSYAYFWSSTVYNDYNSICLRVNGYLAGVLISSCANKILALSVRCLQDSN